MLLIGATLAAALLAAPGAHAQGFSLTTLFAANNQAAGNTFDLEVKNPGGIEVTSLDANVGMGTAQVEVWTRPGTSVGFETSMTGWASRGSASVAGAGQNLPTRVPISFSLPEGIHGIAIAITDSNTVSMQYTDGVPTVFENAQLKLTTSRGLAPPPLSEFGGAFNNRQWNGTIRYTLLTALCKDMQAAVGSAQMNLAVANGELAEASQALAAANEAFDSAGDGVERAEGAKQRAQKKVRKAKKKLKRAKRSDDRAEVRKAKKRLKRARKRLRSAKRTLRSAREELASARVAAEQAEGLANDAQSGRSHAQGVLNQARSAFNVNCT